MERKYTPTGKSYWADNAVYKKEIKLLYKKLVPDMGEAETKHGEMLRAISRLTYEYGNNGNGNAVDAITCDCPECNGSGYEENRHKQDEEDDDQVDCSYCGGDCTIETGKEFENYFEDLVYYLRHNLPKEDKHLVDELETFCLKGEVIAKGDDAFSVYTRLADAVIYFILSSENSPR